MTDKTRDKLLTAIAILLYDIAEQNPTLFVDDKKDDVEALWMAITKAVAEHHKATREAES